MIKTKFVFVVSLVAMLAVGSAWANTPGKNESVGTAHTVYTDQSPTSTEGEGGTTAIAGVTYVNRAVNKAGAAATAAEQHAAAAGKSALAAAESATQAASSAKSANDALSGKQDKLGFTPEDVANKVTVVTSKSDDTQYPSAQAVYKYVSGEMTSLSGKNDSLKTRVDTLEATTVALDEDKQDNLTATGSANRPVYAVAGGVAAVTGVSIPYGKESNPTSWATIWVE